MPSASPPPSRGTSAGDDRSDRRATAELAVAGMHCGACVALIEESLQDQVGVVGASVDLDSGRAVVDYDPSLVGLDTLVTTVAEAGYSATPVA